MRLVPAIITAGMGFTAFVFSACSSDDRPGGADLSSSSSGSGGNDAGGRIVVDGGSEAGATTTDSGLGGDGGDGGPGDAGVDAAIHDEDLCATIIQLSLDVSEGVRTGGSAPTAKGGVLVPGTYVLNALYDYSAPTPAPDAGEVGAPGTTDMLGRSTLRVTPNGLRFLSARGTYPLPPAVLKSYLYKVGSPNLELTGTCTTPATTSSMGFTADGIYLTLRASPTREEIYVRR